MRRRAICRQLGDDRAQEGEIVGGIERPALAGKPRQRRDQGLGREAGAVVADERRHVLAIARPRRLLGGGRERRGRHHLAVETVRPGRRIDVRRIVDAGHGAQAHGLPDHRRIEQRTIGRDADDDIGAGRRHRAGVAIEHVVLGAAMHRHAVLRAPVRDRIVGRRRRGRDPDLVDADRGTRSPHHPGQCRPAAEVRQHLAGQPRRAHAGLDDRYSLHAMASQVSAVPRASARRARLPRMSGRWRGGRPKPGRMLRTFSAVKASPAAMSRTT